MEKNTNFWGVCIGLGGGASKNFAKTLQKQLIC